MILPGYCRGDLGPILEKFGNIPIEPGPEDLRDLPRYFGQAGGQRSGYGDYDIEILAEINHAPGWNQTKSSSKPIIFALKGPT